MRKISEDFIADSLLACAYRSSWPCCEREGNREDRYEHEDAGGRAHALMWCDMPQCYVGIRGRGRGTLPRRRRGRLDQLSRPNSYRGYLERRYKGRGRGA